jgi:nucleotidyltransferase/DNA polymerase involved in DNA repair
MSGRKIIHADMDAFYASVEQRDNPELRGKPVVVAWRGKRSVVCAASYEARRFGVRSAMSATHAERLCPEAVFIPPDFTRYRAASRAVREIFLRHTDLIEPLSLDSRYLAGYNKIDWLRLRDGSRWIETALGESNRNRHVAALFSVAVLAWLRVRACSPAVCAGLRSRETHQSICLASLAGARESIAGETPSPAGRPARPPFPVRHLGTSRPLSSVPVSGEVAAPPPGRYRS